MAFKAFLRIDLKGGTTAEAKRAAIEDIADFRKAKGTNENKPYPTTSIDKWLKGILFMTDLKPSGRGRPVNK